jgi:hypothetical protein
VVQANRWDGGFLDTLSQVGQESPISQQLSWLRPRRRLQWLVANAKWVSYIRLVSYLRRNGIECGEIADLSIQSQLDPVGYR